jgi:hypothetical protein
LVVWEDCMVVDLRRGGRSKENAALEFIYVIQNIFPLVALGRHLALIRAKDPT